MIRLLQNGVAIDPDHEPTMTKSGLHIVSERDDRIFTGVVVAVGPGKPIVCKKCHGEGYQPTGVSVGDRVAYVAWQGRREATVDGTRLVLMSADDLEFEVPAGVVVS